jgi:hypothetical protein
MRLPTKPFNFPVTTPLVAPRANLIRVTLWPNAEIENRISMVETAINMVGLFTYYFLPLKGSGGGSSPSFGDSLPMLP